MIAAVYARKSTEQAGIADEQKSVARYLIEEIVTEARQMFEAQDHDDQQVRLRREVVAVEAEQARLTEAIASGAICRRWWSG